MPTASGQAFVSYLIELALDPYELIVSKCALNTSARTTVQELTAKRLALNPELHVTAHGHQTCMPIRPHISLGYRLPRHQARRPTEPIPALG